MCCFCFCLQGQKDDDKPKGTLKLVKFKRAKSIRKSACANEECTICLEEFNKGEEIQVTPCNHGYHVVCLTKWLRENSKCPMCQKQLRCNRECDENSPLVTSYSIEY